MFTGGSHSFFLQYLWEGLQESQRKPILLQGKECVSCNICRLQENPIVIMLAHKHTGLFETRTYALNFNHYRTRFDQKAPFCAGRHCLDLDGKSPLMVTTISYNEKRGGGWWRILIFTKWLPAQQPSLLVVLWRKLCAQGELLRSLIFGQAYSRS